ncbi:Replication-associated recombination protein A [Acidithiobacillus ferridurans]|uniref:Replication-associated recombination protein A n=1 Tax=Acidithiobacillus ferridurans TaxID=1232575 RepID=A0A2Z6IGJ9_ACIFI|nr:Replication-associated recombination protein A [Acidithiobacillus ferridurans]
MAASSTDPRPLAARMRPQTLDAYVGQRHLLGKECPLQAMVQAGHLHSMILWGPPGSGKTTLAQLLAHTAGRHFQVLSAVNSGVREIRAAVSSAEAAQSLGQGTVLFIDEIHRFNKSQQDALLPYVEEGVVTLIGATTENPSFALINALLSRARVHVLKALTEEELGVVLDHTLADRVLGLGALAMEMSPEVRKGLLTAADGDARRLLNLLDLAVQLAPVREGKTQITAGIIAAASGHSWRRFDQGGKPFTTKFPLSTSPCAVPIPTRPSTGWRGCSTAAPTPFTLPVGWYAWLPKMLALPTHGLWKWPSPPKTPTPFLVRPRGSWRWRRLRPISPVVPKVTAYTRHGMPCVPSSKAAGVPKCLSTCATRPPHCSRHWITAGNINTITTIPTPSLRNSLICPPVCVRPIFMSPATAVWKSVFRSVCAG